MELMVKWVGGSNIGVKGRGGMILLGRNGRRRSA